MFSFIKRGFVLLIGFLLIAAFIWFAGPYFAFASYRPLETEYSRLVAIALLIVCWAVSVLIKRLRASQASAALVSAVVRQSRREQEPQPSAEALKLRERFEEAVEALTDKRRPGRSLYDLPWYVFIGAPGSGKTTALVNSGLRFPAEQRRGKAAVRGVGGTRNCDWWFTDEAIFLDTAGRYTTQDSDATSDSEGWREFLALLTKYRKRRPLNGVVLTISAQDLLLQGDAGREAHVDAARHRLKELARELQIVLPVYVMVTKCDMVAGFSEYFDDLTREDRAQVWGVTFTYEESSSDEAAEALPREFDRLMSRLNSGVFARLDGERGARRRATIFGFPQQMAALRDPLAEFVAEVFATNEINRPTLLRGVYLTSGTQDGTQIDRLLGSIGGRFGIAPDAVAPAPGRGKAFFVERLLREVVIGESGLAGVNRRLEMRQAAWQVGAYAAVGLVLIGGLIGLTVSYGNNRGYLTDVAADVANLRQVTPASPRASLEVLLPQLNAVRAVADSANRYQDGTPWGMRWGLYQGASVGNAARDAYVRELDGIVLPRFADRLRQHLTTSASEPEKLYVYLKAYLMLGDPRRLDKKLLRSLADLEWRMPDAAPGAGTSLSTHFDSLLEYSGTLRPIPIDQALVAQARGTIRQASIQRIMFDQLRRSYADDTAPDLRLDVSAGIGGEKVLGRTSGRKLSDPVPGFYTKAVFKEATGAGMISLVKQFADEEWVWGGSGLSRTSWTSLTSQVVDLYEHEYNRVWDDLLNDLEIRSFPSVQQYADALTILVGPTSPLRGILKTVVDNTSIVAPAADPAAQSGGLAGLGSRITDSASDVLSSARRKITGTASPPGTAITEHFQPIHRMMAGAPAPIDAAFDQIRKIRDQLQTLGPQAGGGNPLTALADPAFLDLRRVLRQEAAGLPPPINELIRQIAQNTGGSVSSDATRELVQLYREKVVAECQKLVEGRYPFGDGHAGEVSLSDFSNIFGYGGVYDKFFSDRLEKLVNTSTRPWSWRPESVQSQLGLLSQFERADEIRQMFFNTKTLGVEYNVTLSKLDGKATRFYLDIDGQQFDVKPGSDPTTRGGSWPPKKDGYATGAFEDREAAPERVEGTQGPWALFKMIDKYVVSNRETEGVLKINTRYHQAVMTIAPAGGSGNPFAARDWRQFTCGT